MFIDSKEVVSHFDPHFKIFHDLMPFKVQEILLVSSLYDAFIMEEDGSIATRLINEYHGLNLSKPPKITRTSSAEEALKLIDRSVFDMVITMPFPGGMDAFDFGRAIKKLRPDLPVILVAHNMRATFPDRVGDYGIDKTFLWCCEADLLLAIIKNVEDHRNVDADTRSAMVRVIIYVEDSPLYRSLLLPLLYSEIVGQTQAVLSESLNQRHRLLRMRARPKILIATSYEEAMALYQAYGPYVFSVISDARYKKAGQIDANAGRKLLEYIRSRSHDIPLLMVSTEEENRQYAQHIPAVFLDKNSPLIRDELHNFFLNYLGFGDFVFRLPDETVVGRASSLYEFEKQLKVIPEESLGYHALRNHFSNWVMARAEVELARRIHRDSIGGTGDILSIRDELVSRVHSLRKHRQQGVVAGFAAGIYDPEVMEFVKIGNGSMGGKARGIAFMWACLQRAYHEDSVLRSFSVSIPRTCVITADGFDTFVEEQNLYYCKNLPDKQVADLFLDADLPAWLRIDLRLFLEKTETPLSIRSSSLLEDGQSKPYAGLYSTYFLANNHPDFEERFSQFESAIKLVYASTWFEGPIAFSKVSGVGREDSMAVIIQQVVGEQYGDFYYPGISGVAQSHNFYPVMGMRAEEGIANIALGIGKTVVEGGKSLWFSPARPKKLIQFSSVKNMFKYSQNEFYALDVSPENCLLRGISNLVLRNVRDAESESPVSLLASTYIAQENRVRDSFLPGPKIITFAQILKYDGYPLAEILRELLAIGKAGMGGEVEIEFAVNITSDPGRFDFYFLQIRPMISGGDYADVRICDHERQGAVCRVSRSLGHGHFDTIRDIVYVDPVQFDGSKSREMVLEIGSINRRLLAENIPFLLIGPGRWGSSDPWLGIPVQWADISGVAGIIEVKNDVTKAEASQGTHFFQNITSLGIPYLNLDEGEPGKKRKGDFFKWEWLQELESIKKGVYVHHVRSEQPFILKCDGTRSESVIFENSDQCKVECEVNGSTLWSQKSIFSGEK